MFNLLGKKARGRFAFPSGEIVTNSDSAIWAIRNILQLGAIIGKSTTIEPTLGNREDIFVQLPKNSGWNAVGFTNPGLEGTIEGFNEIKEAIKDDDVFLMPQIGESAPDAFAYCASEFEKKGKADGYEGNVSCGHATKGGINLSIPQTVYETFAAMRKVTNKPLIAKINASTPDLVKLVGEALRGGATAISLINTIPGPHPELKNKFGGYSGAPIFPVLVKTLKLLKKHFDVPYIAMGGIQGAEDIRTLEKIDPNLFYEIGTALAEMTSKEIIQYFHQLEIDMKEGTDFALEMTRNKKALQYEPFIIREVIKLSDTLRLFKFYESMDAGPGQYVSMKVGDSRTTNKEDDEFSKPFSVANDKDGLELVIRNAGAATSKIFSLQENTAVRIKGPLGKRFEFPKGATVFFVGAGCGIAPIYHAATHHEGKKVFILGARTKSELIYLDQFSEMGKVQASTDDGSYNYYGFLPELLQRYLQQENPKDIYFFNCGPETAMKQIDAIERKYTTPDRIFHLVERMSSCNSGICGKCTIPSGKRACADGPVFSAEEFTPGQYTRDKTGKKVKL